MADYYCSIRRRRHRRRRRRRQIVFSTLWQNPSADLCQTSTAYALPGGRSTSTPLLFRSLGVNCSRMAQVHRWGLPETEITR